MKQENSVAKLGISAVYGGEEVKARKLFQLEDVLMKAAKRENHPAMIGAIRLQCEIAQVLK
jgi:hypothetical protein